MTQTMSPYHVIFEDATWIADAAFTIEELRDIVNHGMSAGVPMFIYTKDNVAWFDENDDVIEDYLSDWFMTTWVIKVALQLLMAPDIGSFANSRRNVWTYVELKAHEILCSVDPNY